MYVTRAKGEIKYVVRKKLGETLLVRTVTDTSSASIRSLLQGNRVANVSASSEVAH